MALFIISIISLTLLAVNQQLTSGAQAYTQTVLSSRAFYAAESGLQFALQDALSTTPCRCADHSYPFDVTGLKGCRASTSCQSFIAAGEQYCTIKSVG